MSSRSQVTATVSHSIFISCSATNGGGAISSSLYGGSTAPSLTISWIVIQDCTANSASGQAIHIYECKSFKWEYLCITGRGTLISRSGTVPTHAELTNGCLTNPFTCSPQRNVLTKLSPKSVLVYHCL